MLKNTQCLTENTAKSSSVFSNLTTLTTDKLAFWFASRLISLSMNIKYQVTRPPFSLPVLNWRFGHSVGGSRRFNWCIWRSHYFFSENLWDSSRNINQVKKSEAFKLLMQSVKNAPPLLSHTSLQIGDTPELSRHQPLEKKNYIQKLINAQPSCIWARIKNQWKMSAQLRQPSPSYWHHRHYHQTYYHHQ